MKILVDSSFFFPFIRVEMKDCSKEDILSLLRNPHYEIYRSELALFEISAKGSKYCNSGQIAIEDLVEGIISIQHDPAIHVIPINYSQIQILANEFRKIHADFIDCITLSSAICFCDTFLTLNGFLSDTAKKEWAVIIAKHNAQFQVQLWSNFQRPIH